MCPLHRHERLLMGLAPSASLWTDICIQTRSLIQRETGLGEERIRKLSLFKIAASAAAASLCEKPVFCKNASRAQCHILNLGLGSES